jgi:hypothetical protein
MTILSEEEPPWIFDCFCTENAGYRCGSMTEKISGIKMKEPKKYTTGDKVSDPDTHGSALFLKAGSGSSLE